jgi:hypothetical protein
MFVASPVVSPRQIFPANAVSAIFAAQGNAIDFR